ncbi:bifunctional 2-C-methyl-D-erythritol 4-phosphate cytidylyltransferase/2-C-methyl-D-erythritol 2,4-cyclodiphosphate synthase [Sphingomonas bacterium]|uniref:bifunctional 2-C-methyl-D-erythritol 4-phosphate cytidylyltransferase/2-C-methyl-D-erythritol 2,4-cyclodiphosphate synthase n=1 Tax=Sphingomonas bacterium TaxID=1895847 RepID=UPI001575DA7F|nr:bifunctional 2-C-methyl-D-erythritol 4-phosphate cytidylyltransferase/2-C-methyl-D-erythritol 2,4-cyclodiphosphate synthase [Sphingomonas bacterium]
MSHRTTALVVAAGSGSRIGGDIPKQYRPVAGKAVLAHAIDALLAHPGVDDVQVVIGAGQEGLYRAAIGDRPLPFPIIGGVLRRESVARGLTAVDSERVLVHDAARPFLPPEVVDRLLAALDGRDGAVPVLPVADTLALGGDALGDIVPRQSLVRVQTPQAFRTEVLRSAHAGWDALIEATDDAQMVRKAGHQIAMVEGSAMLEKLTWTEDFGAAERRFAPALVSRTAMGFDVHAFAEGDGLWLGGLRIPHDRALSGHSDADVALHALTDALLGTIGDGDIGSHFPPSDARWRGAPSSGFLIHARDLVVAAGGRIDHVDLTIICEAPKIGPHRPAIRARIAELLELQEGQVSVKATTTESLGFTGRGEGIAAQAVATVRLPERRA